MPVNSVFVSLMDEGLSRQGVRGRRGRGVVHWRQVRMGQSVLVVHRASLHVASAVEAFVVPRLSHESSARARVQGSAGHHERFSSRAQPNTTH